MKLKKSCAPATALALYVSNEEKTLARVDIIFDDDSKTSYILDWREEDGIVLPRVVQRLGEESNDVYFREDAKVILKRTILMAEAAAKAAEEEAQAAEASAGEAEEAAEEEMVEFDASGDTAAEEETSEEEEDVFEEE